MKTNLKKYLGARRPIIWCSTSDNKEIDDLLNEVLNEFNNYVIYEFRALGAVDFKTKEISEECKTLYPFIDSIYTDGFEKETFLLIKEAENEIKKPEVLAYLKKIAELKYSNPKYNFTTIIVADTDNIPSELEKFTSILEIKKMNKDEIEKYIIKFAKINNVKVDDKDIGEIAISLKGLSKLEIDHVLNMMIESKKNISISDRQVIIREKGQIIKKSAILELVDFKEKITDIGGLYGLREWLDDTSKVFRKLDEAKKFGVDTPKGVLLTGMPGCGKSLAAKASARLFNAPLLRLDVGRLLGKYVGESEHNMRTALKTAESISPCVLWIDEIEKAFSGIDQNGGASDITKRLFGHFLTWLQEKENTVFVVATANDISSFPPEFLRKGRFDEVFFVDFPNEEERERIFEIHLEKRGQNIENFNCLSLAKKTEGYCGADIEEIVKLTLKKAFVDGEEEIDTKDVEASIKEIDSLSVILDDKIEQLKKGFERFKIRSASKKLPKRARRNKKRKNNGEGIETFKDMVFVQGGKYVPSFFKEEREVGDLEVCKYQTTQDMWMEVMEKNPSNNKGNRLPVDSVSWWDALEYCNKLSEKYDLQPVYVIEGSGKEKTLKINQLNGEIVYPDLADFKKTEGFRLPTLLEHEWFVRGGEIAIQDETFDTKYAGSNNIDEVAWYIENSESKTHAVGTKKPNELGLYDCTGNVQEWLYDTSLGYISEDKPYVYDESIKERLKKGSDYFSFRDNSSFFPFFKECERGIFSNAFRFPSSSNSYPSYSSYNNDCFHSFRICRSR